LAINRVEMRRMVIAEVHIDYNSKELTDPRHNSSI